MSWIGLFILFFICAIVIVGTLFGMVVIGLTLRFFIGETVEKVTDRTVKRRKKKNDLV